MSAGGTMSLTGHLAELRRRLIVCVIACAAGFGVAYYFSEGLYRLLASPLVGALPPGQDYMVYTGVVEPFFIYLKVGLLGGIILASPVIFYEVWAFVAPGLYRDERRWFVYIVLSSFLLFSAGAIFAYLVVFPFGFKYLLSYTTADLKPMLSMSEYFSMVTRLLLAFGAVFQLPLILLVLARFGLVTASGLISWWRYAIVVSLIISAILTPTPDIFNQLLMAGPLMLLYWVGVLAAWAFGKEKTEKTQDVAGEE